jgi:uncharacterized protein DUF3597
MSIFGDIMSKIFGSSAKAETPGASSASTPPTSTTTPPPMATPTGASSVPAGRTAASPSAAPSSTTPQAPIDIKAVLRDLAKSKKQKLNYEKSIVDLLKLLDLDSSAAARKELATELGYSGDMKKSAKMNVWLHKQVMIKLAANGGKVPKEWMD